MRRAIAKRWFLLGLLVLIPSGLALGRYAGSAADAEAVSSLGSAALWVAGQLNRLGTRLLVATILLLMAFTLDSHHLRQSFRSPAPVILACLVNYGFLPLAGWGLALLQLSPDYAYGLMIAACVPCTLAAASVWTRKAKGNDAVSLLSTLVTNSACFVVTPLWLALMIRGQDVPLKPRDMIVRLLVAVLVPTIAGQTLRLIPKLRGLATSYKTQFGVIAQSCVLVVVFAAATRAGGRLSGDGPGPGTVATLWVWVCCIAAHLVAMALGSGGAKLLGLSLADRKAVMFASSQKTLPVGILIATSATFAASAPFAVFPMLMFHASQLFIDTVIADRLALQTEEG